MSRADDKICYSDIQNMLESAQRHNLKNGITGLLMYKENHFIQILEGSESAVLETMARIIQDRRNHHLRVMVESRSNQRIFENWAMAFHDGDIDRSTADLIQKVFDTALDENKKEKESLLQWLQCFRKTSQLFKQS